MRNTNYHQSQLRFAATFATMLKNIIATCAAFILLAACDQGDIKEVTDWASIYKKYGIDSAAFEMRDQSKDAIRYLNKTRGNTRYSPASTFKILACLIALETSVAPDEELVIKYDGQATWNDAWKKDMNMREAYITSSEPYFKELMKRVGIADIKKWVDTIEYGNMRIGTDPTTFWTNDTLKITPDEQVGFMKKLYYDELPFSKRTMRIVRSLMLQENTSKYRFYYKTGARIANGKMYGWLVGFVEDSVNHPYFFASHAETKDTALDIKTTDIKIVKEIFSGIIAQ